MRHQVGQERCGEWKCDCATGINLAWEVGVRVTIHVCKLATGIQVDGSRRIVACKIEVVVSKELWSRNFVTNEKPYLRNQPLGLVTHRADLQWEWERR